jgi:metal-responsive CopG/Arc/MetJ family transcriptional regulator
VATNSTQAFATRLPEEQAAKIEAILDREETTRSESLRQAAHHYFETDLDNLRRDDPTASVESPMEEMVE